MSFFKESVLLQSKAPRALIPQCGKCGLYKLCHTPKMPVSGEGRKKILVVAEAPGKTEDREGIQLCGKTGKRFERELKRLGVDMREDCWLTNSIICRPPNNKILPAHIEYCQPNLIKTVEQLQPETIITLGGPAIKSLVTWLWKSSGAYDSMTQWLGWNVPCQKINSWICPTYHPSFVERENSKVADRLFREHLTAALKHKGRPWKKVPNYESQIQRIHSAKKAARLIEEIERKGGTIAFDYETNMLKPDDDRSRIVCCSICWEGKHTIAFPWHGVAIDAMRKLLRSKSTRKIASNLQFEERWTLHEFGRGVRNWHWDTMLGAHWLDSKADITSIKFQAFVLLGFEAYDEHIKPLLGTNGDDRVNQVIKEVDLNQLLLYNGLDSLLEFKVARIQRKVSGHYGNDA